MKAEEVGDGMEARKKMTAGDVHGREARSRNLLVHARVVVDDHGVEADPRRRSARRGRLHGDGALKVCSAVLPPTLTGNREESGREEKEPAAAGRRRARVRVPGVLRGR